MYCNVNHRHCATQFQPETKKIGDISNACVSLYRSLKLLSVVQITFTAVQLKPYYTVLCNLDLIGRIFSKLQLH